MFASSVEVLGAAKSTIITINPLENVLPSGYDIGGVHQIVSPISNSQFAKKKITNIYFDVFFNWQTEGKNLFWANKKLVFFFNCSN